MLLMMSPPSPLAWWAFEAKKAKSLQRCFLSMHIHISIGSQRCSGCQGHGIQSTQPGVRWERFTQLEWRMEMTHPPQILTLLLGYPPGKKASSYFQPQTPMFHLCCSLSFSCHASLKSQSTTSVLGVLLSPWSHLSSQWNHPLSKILFSETEGSSPTICHQNSHFAPEALPVSGVPSVLRTAVRCGPQTGLMSTKQRGQTLLSPVSPATNCSLHARCLWPSLLPRHRDNPDAAHWQPGPCPSAGLPLGLHIPSIAISRWTGWTGVACTDPEEPFLILAHHPAKSSPANLSSLHTCNVTAQLQKPG